MEKDEYDRQTTRTSALASGNCSSSDMSAKGLRALSHTRGRRLRRGKGKMLAPKPDSASVAL